METKSHAALGRYLLERSLRAVTAAERRAFLFGCVEPDFNLATYLRGIAHDRRPRGHHYANTAPCIGRLADRLERGRAAGALYYFRLGQLMHYVTDSFTWPHNEGFTDSLRAHARYEQALQPLFCGALRSADPIPAQLVRGPLSGWLAELHRKYLEAPGSMGRDCFFTLTAALTAALRLGGRCAAELASAS